MPSAARMKANLLVALVAFLFDVDIH